MEQDVRWRQRFHNFEKAFEFLKKWVTVKEYDELQSAGLVQSFEFTFELAWKTFKDLLEERGFNPKYPREVIKQAFQSDLIQDGHTWIDMLDKRNELTHTYNEEQAQEAIRIIKEEYFPAIEQAYLRLKEE